MLPWKDSNKNFNLCFKLDGFMKIKPKLDSKNKNELT